MLDLGLWSGLPKTVCEEVLWVIRLVDPLRLPWAPPPRLLGEGGKCWALPLLGPPLPALAGDELEDGRLYDRVSDLFEPRLGNMNHA